jgi:hypothetical protein
MWNVGAEVVETKGRPHLGATDLPPFSYKYPMGSKYYK